VQQFADNKELQKEWKQAKIARKEKLAAYIKAKTGYTINPNALFDIQVCIHKFYADILKKHAIR
jgi:starch phosphorylase